MGLPLISAFITFAKPIIIARKETILSTMIAFLLRVVFCLLTLFLFNVLFFIYLRNTGEKTVPIQPTRIIIQRKERKKLPNVNSNKAVTRLNIVKMATNT